jgi:hypothetical protein
MASNNILTVNFKDLIAKSGRATRMPPLDPRLKFIDSEYILYTTHQATSESEIWNFLTENRNHATDVRVE